MKTISTLMTRIDIPFTGTLDSQFKKLSIHQNSAVPLKFVICYSENNILKKEHIPELKLIKDKLWNMRQKLAQVIMPAAKERDGSNSAAPAPAAATEGTTSPIAHTFVIDAKTFERRDAILDVNEKKYFVFLKVDNEKIGYITYGMKPYEGHQITPFITIQELEKV